jgi:hypothetical protein
VPMPDLSSLTAASGPFLSKTMDAKSVDRASVDGVELRWEQLAHGLDGPGAPHDLPIGLWTASTVLDLVRVAGRSQQPGGSLDWLTSRPCRLQPRASPSGRSRMVPRPGSTRLLLNIDDEGVTCVRA